MKIPYLGLLLKVLALLSKMLFLFVAVPLMNEGVFGAYFFILSSALIGSRILSIGLMDYLPNIIEGSEKKAKRYIRPLYLLVVIPFVIFFLFSKYELGLVIGLAITLAICQILIGVLRTIIPSAFEVISNIPWIIFSLSILFNPNVTLVHMVQLLFISQIIIVTCYLAYFFGKYRQIDISENVRTKLGVKELKELASIVLSSILQLFMLRFYILFNKDTLSGADLDYYSIVISVSEAVWQLVMVFPNRFYSVIKSKETFEVNFTKKFMQVFIFHMIAVAGCLAVLYLFADFIPLSVLPYDLIVQSTLCFSVVLWSFIKFYFWSKKQFNLTLKLESVMVASAMGCLLLLSSFSAYTIVFSIFVFATLIVIYIYSKGFKSEPNNA